MHACRTAFPEVCRLWLFFPPCAVAGVGSFCRNDCGGLERQSRARFALSARHHKSMSCPTLAPTELMRVCTVRVLFPSRRMSINPHPFSFVQVLFPSRSVGIAPPPFPLFFCWRLGLRLGLCAFPARGQSSRGIFHFSTFDGGGDFYTASSFRGGWPNACAIDA